MSFDQQPLSLSTIFIRPDLTFTVVSGETVIEVHLSPEEALDICDALEEFAIAAKVTSTLERTPDDKQAIGAAPGAAPS